MRQFQVGQRIFANEVCFNNEAGGTVISSWKNSLKDTVFHVQIDEVMYDYETGINLVCHLVLVENAKDETLAKLKRAAKCKYATAEQKRNYIFNKLYVSEFDVR